MSPMDPTEWGSYRQKVDGLEEDMEKILGDKPSSHASRIGALEDDRKARITAQATIGAILTGAFAFVVWVAQSGVIEHVDALRRELHRHTPTVAATPSPRVP